MFKFALNQKSVTVAADKNLLEYLREDARLTSVKDGCAEGVCGSCSVLVDGKAWRACKLTIAKVEGKQSPLLKVSRIARRRSIPGPSAKWGQCSAVSACREW